VLYCALTGHWPHAEAGASNLPDAAREAAGQLVPPRQVRGGVPGHLSDLAIDLLDGSLAPPSADVLSAHLNRLEGDREEAFFSAGGPLDFEQPSYPGGPATERRRSVSKLVIGVAVMVVLSLAGLLLTVKALSGSDTGAGARPAATTPGAAARPNGQPTPVHLSPSQVRIVDSMKGDRKELAGAGLMVDGDFGTYWKSDHYLKDPAFGGSKIGMGVLIDLGAPKAVTTVKITFANQGAAVDLRKGTALFPATAEGDDQIYQSYKPIGEPREAGATTVLNSDGEPVQYLLIWISKLPPAVDDPSRYQVRIEEIEISAN
jgi:eukaryotic-like serine/threonine-protein kinase